MDPDFEIESKGIDTAALEREIARRVEERRKAGVYGPEVEAMLAERLPEEGYESDLSPIEALDYAATRAKASWEVGTAYPVETEKRFLRPLIIFMKRIARFWARIAVAPIQREQTAFIRHAASALEALKEQAVAERVEAMAAEEDLSPLAESMIGTEEAHAMETAVLESFGQDESITVVGPCSSNLVDALMGGGRSVYRLSAGSSWDSPPGSSTRCGPVSFLSRVSNESLGAVLVCELAFWLKPESLIELARRSYLALSTGGSLTFAVHSCLAGSPAPAWCSGPVIARMLGLAGFERIETREIPGPQASGPSGLVLTGRKP